MTLKECIVHCSSRDKLQRGIKFLVSPQDGFWKTEMIGYIPPHSMRTIRECLIIVSQAVLTSCGRFRSSLVYIDRCCGHRVRGSPTQ